MNDKQLLALGKKMHANPSAITSNMEGYALRQYRDQLKREAIERDGCCGGKPDGDGVCFGIGLCPMSAQGKEFQRSSDELAKGERL